MAGYSGTPLPKKLGLKPQFRIAFFQLPADVKTALQDSLSVCRMIKDDRTELDFAMIFIKTRDPGEGQGEKPLTTKGTKVHEGNHCDKAFVILRALRSSCSFVTHRCNRSTTARCGS